jgi:hypothetical protein
MSALVFETLPQLLAIVRLPASAEIPTWCGGSWTTVSRTSAELSIICAQDRVPPACQQERDKIALGIVGVVPMTTVGLLASLCRALADRLVPVFVVSTYDTDWLLVSAQHFELAKAAMEDLGHTVRGACP